MKKGALRNLRKEIKENEIGNKIINYKFLINLNVWRVNLLLPDVLSSAQPDNQSFDGV